MSGHHAHNAIAAHPALLLVVLAVFVLAMAAMGWAVLLGGGERA